MKIIRVLLGLGIFFSLTLIIFLFNPGSFALSAGEEQVSAPAVITLNPVSDTYVSQALPATNFNNLTYFEVGSSEFLEEKFALVKFNLGSIPPGSTITSAIFSAYLSAADFGNISISVYRVSTDWVSSTVTWNTRPSTMAGYNSASIGTTHAFYNWDVRVLVDRWVNQSASYPNYGLALRGPTTSTYYRDFTSIQGLNQPKLVINYTAPTATPSITRTPTKTPTGTQPSPTSSNTSTKTPTATLTPPPSSIGGRVWNDLDRDGIQDAGEPGIPDVRIDLIQNFSVINTYFSDANGQYLFTNLLAGGYTLNIDPWTLPPGFSLVSGFMPHMVFLNNGENALDENFGYATAPTPTPPAEADLDLYFDSFDVVQVVPDTTLVEDKPTVVRVYVGVRGTNAIVPNVTGRLIRVGVDDWSSGLRSNTISVDPAKDPVLDNREDINGTLNFSLPADWRTGNYWINVWININRDVDECTLCSDNNIGSTQLNFYAANPLDVTMVRVFAGGATPPRSMRAETVRWLKKVYPLNHVNIYISSEDPLEADYDYTTREGLHDLVDDLWVLNFWTMDGNENLKYYGMLDESVVTGDFSGMGFVSGDEAAGKISPGEEVGQRRMAHEVGHNLGRDHAPCISNPPDNVDPNYPNADGSLDTYGLDATSLTIYPITDFDIMSYCNPKWISVYTYNALVPQFITGPSAPQADRTIETAPVPAANGSYLLVSGSLDSGLVNKLQPFYRLDLPTGSNDLPGGGTYSIALKNSTGGTLFTRYFNPIENSETPAAGVFHEILPYPSALTRIVILHGTTEIGNRTVSANTPSVKLLSPNGGEYWAANSQQLVSWSGGDLDGDTVFYTLQYSPDNGLTWHALATNLTTQSHIVDASSLGGSNQAFIRVIASDGVNTAVDTSDSVFSVATKGPEVYILDPLDGSVAAPGALVELDGLATDVEDGPLADSALVWSSDRQGVLGTGENITFTTLLPGWHTITLTAKDSNNQISSDSVQILVGYQVQLPLIRR